MPISILGGSAQVLIAYREQGDKEIIETGILQTTLSSFCERRPDGERDHLIMRVSR